MDCRNLGFRFFEKIVARFVAVNGKLGVECLGFMNQVSRDGIKYRDKKTRRKYSRGDADKYYCILKIVKRKTGKKNDKEVR